LDGKDGRLGQVELLAEVKEGPTGIAYPIQIALVISFGPLYDDEGFRRGDGPRPWKRMSRFRSLPDGEGAYWKVRGVDALVGAVLRVRRGPEGVEAGDTVMGVVMLQDEKVRASR
jgi:hypothetical protein